MVIKTNCEITLLHRKCRDGICRYPVRCFGQPLFQFKVLCWHVFCAEAVSVLTEAGGIYVVSDERKISSYENIIFAVMKLIPGTQFSPMLSSSVAKFRFSHEVV